MNLSQKQINSIREADARINIWQGAVRSGKSFASLWRFLHFCRFGAEGPLMIVGRTTDTINRNIIFPMQSIPGLGPNVRHYAHRREINLFGRTMYLVSANDARAETKIRGATLAGAYVDEMTLIPESFIKMLLSRLSLPGAKLFGTTNPDSPYHWLKTDFIDRVDALDLKTWHFKLEDNPSLSAEFMEIIKKEYKGLWYQRFIEGLWVQAEGAVYDFFDESIHVIDYPRSQASYYICGVDYGTTNPCAFVLVGVNKDYYPNYWVESEYYFDSRKAQRQKTDSEYAEDLKRFLEGKVVKAIYIDPSAASFKLELSKEGFSNLFEAKNDVVDGIRFVAKHLTNGTLKVTKQCPKLINEFQSYVWDEKAAMKGEDKPKKENDHALDALRYAIYSHFYDKDGKGLSAEQIDRLYAETRGAQPELPRWFQDPSDSNYRF